MRLGIFAKTFTGPDPAAILGNVRTAGYSVAQYNMTCSGLPAIPLAIPAGTMAEIAVAAKTSGVGIVAMSATCNMIHPDVAVREAGLTGLEVIAAASAGVTDLLTLCTGTRDPEDQWRSHPDNETPEAWHDLLMSMERAVAIAERYDVYLGIEPELANVVNSARKARALIDDIGSPRLRIILDPANLFETATSENQRRVVSSAIELLADRIVMGHAKDRTPAGAYTAAGNGVLDFPHYLGALRDAGFDGAIVAHGLDRSEAQGVAKFLRTAAQEAGLAVDP